VKEILVDELLSIPGAGMRDEAGPDGFRTRGPDEFVRTTNIE
jgi:hypothetical protein